jgi:hypothetical protein
MEAPLTVLYSHAIRGDLALLPRLHRFIRALRDEVEGRALLVDLGQSCDPAVWHCAATGGRSTLLVLDAMGYHAANVRGTLGAEDRARLAGQVTVRLVDEGHDHAQDGVLLTVHERETTWGLPYDVDMWLQVVLAPGEATTLQGGVLRLAAVTAGQIGVARVAGGTVQADVRTMPPETPPDPTIAGVVDFVIAEARYYQNRH